MSEVKIIKFSDINKIRKVQGTAPDDTLSIRQLNFLSADNKEDRVIISEEGKLTDPIDLEKDKVIIGFYVTYDVFDIAAFGLLAWIPDSQEEETKIEIQQQEEFKEPDTKRKQAAKTLKKTFKFGF